MLCRMFCQLIRYLFFMLVVKPFIYLGLGVNISGSENLPNTRLYPSIIVANHNSHVDTLLLMSMFADSQIMKIHPVAAADYFCNTKLRTFLFKTLIGIIPLSRKLKKASKEEIFKDLNDALRSGDTIVIYPEGTRGDSNEIQKFKSGVAHLAKMNPDIPIVPIFINGPDKILPKGEFLWVPFISDIYIGEHIYYDGTSTVEFTKRIQTAVEKLKNDHRKKEEL